MNPEYKYNHLCNLLAVQFWMILSLGILVIGYMTNLAALLLIGLGGFIVFTLAGFITLVPASKQKEPDTQETKEN